MRAIVIEAPGGPEVLKLGEVPDPTPHPGDLLVRVRAAGVNRADLLQRLGRYPPPPGASETLGMEVAGEVISLAPGAGGEGPLKRTYEKGDRVMALIAGGGYAELARVPAAQAMPIPEQLTFEEAAAIPEVFLTAYLNLFMVGDLIRGEVVVVHAAGSGVGTAALQLCRGTASAVIATASAGKLEALRQFGATHLLARDEVPAKLADAVRGAAGRGADLILDLVGGSYLSANIGALALHGRLILVATQGGSKAELDILTVMQKRLSLIGSTLRSRTPEQKAALCNQFAERALPRFSPEGAAAQNADQLRPVVAKTFPLAEAAQAHELLARNELIGKIVLTV